MTPSIAPESSAETMIPATGVPQYNFIFVEKQGYG